MDGANVRPNGLTSISLLFMKSVPCFSNPHSLFLSEDLLEKYGLVAGEPVEVETSRFTTVAKAKNLDKLDFEKERRAKFLAICRCLDTLPVDENISIYRKYLDQNEELDISANSDLNSFLKTLGSPEHLRSIIDCKIGIGLMRRDQKNKPNEIVSTAYFTSVKQHLGDCLVDNEVKIQNINKVSDFESPEKVYFCSSEYSLNEHSREKLREKIEDLRIFPQSFKFSINRG